MFFNFYPTTAITRGKINSLIFNYKTNCYFQIPGFIDDIIGDFKQKSITEILSQYNSIETKEKINNLLDWLVENNFGCITKDLIPFKSINTEHTNFGITNAIVELDCNQTRCADRFLDSLKQLYNLGCEAVEVRLYNNSPNYDISGLLKKIELSDFNSVELLIEKSIAAPEKILKELCYKHLSLKRLTIFNAPYTKSIEFKELSCFLEFSEKNINIIKSCGAISKDFFIINQRLHIESQNHNTCLNRKISIDANGDIKNCPSMAKSYGNIKDTSLQQALKRKGFKNVWNISKDKIAVCRDCEFRHICTDCRAYIENPDDIYSKPLKCGYNPYTAEWEEWSTNPLKQKVIEYYHL